MSRTHKDSLISRKAVYQVLRDYMAQFKAYPLYTLIGMIMPAIGTICVFFVPPLFIGKIVDRIAQGGDVSVQSVAVLIGSFAGIWLLGEAMWRIGMHYLILLETKALRALNAYAFDAISERDYAFFANTFVGTLTKKAFSYARNFESFADTLTFSVINNVLPTIFAVVVLWQYSPIIPLALLGALSIVVLVAIPIIRKRSVLVAERHDAYSKISGRLSDALTNMLAVKSFAQEQTERATYATYVDKAAEVFKKTADYQNIRFDSIISPLYVATNALGLLLAVYFADALNLEPSAIVVVFSYYTLVTRMFWEINRIYRNVESSISESAEFTQMFINPPDIRDVPSAQPLNAPDGKIEFVSAGFSYSESSAEDASEKLFLENFSLTIPAGQKVGLVGHSGSGKTTITKLLLRFADLHKGKILIDEQDIATVTQHSLRTAIAYVPQEPLLFHRSLYENIAYGDTTASRDDVLRAAKLARADEFIEKLPQGYDTLVGERGIKLSGGQRQRIAIARAMIRSSPILILDEATSALDSESERYIQEGLAELMEGRTAIVVAHRLSTIKHLDRIIVLEDGKIIEDGTHDELIRAGGTYADLWSHQSGGFITE